jgi:hypothetical protein
MSGGMPESRFLSHVDTWFIRPVDGPGRAHSDWTVVALAFFKSYY